MPVGISEAVAIWVMLVTLSLAAPLMAIAFYWRAPRPKAWAVFVSTVLLYPVIWSGHWAFNTLAAGSEAVVLLFYLPAAGSLLVALAVLYAVRALVRRLGYQPAPLKESREVQ